jgi:DNA polymerase-3 subunit alpha
VKTHLTKKGDKMAFMTLDTLEGPMEVTVFSDIYAAKSGLLMPNMIVMIQARVNYRNSEAGLLVSDVFPVEDAEKLLTRALHVRVPYEKLGNGAARELAETIGQDAFRGDCDVYLHCATPAAGELTIHATQACRVTPNRNLQRAIEALLGAGTVYCSGGMNLPTHRPPEELKPQEPPWRRHKKKG